MLTAQQMRDKHADQMEKLYQELLVKEPTLMGEITQRLGSAVLGETISIQVSYYMVDVERYLSFLGYAAFTTKHLFSIFYLEIYTDPNDAIKHLQDKIKDLESDLADTSRDVRRLS